MDDHPIQEGGRERREGREGGKGAAILLVASCYRNWLIRLQPVARVRLNDLPIDNDIYYLKKIQLTIVFFSAWPHVDVLGTVIKGSLAVDKRSAFGPGSITQSF